MKAIQVRFWKHVSRGPTAECWEWRGYRNAKGYGVMAGDNEKNIKAHRASWIIAHGDIQNGLCVLHKCDNPACVNPAHLFLGTLADNDRDCRRKGRNTRGEINPKAKLNPKIVHEIRSDENSHTTTAALAQRYGISASVVSRVRRKLAWKHISP